MSNYPADNLFNILIANSIKVLMYQKDLVHGTFYNAAIPIAAIIFMHKYLPGANDISSFGTLVFGQTSQTPICSYNL
jgi:hypothetical protein